MVDWSELFLSESDDRRLDRGNIAACQGGFFTYNTGFVYGRKQ